jgi:Fe-S-cluster-containing dehydrogenase component
MIIDVAECTNCHLCTLATMDEYLDNEWPGYSAPMPRHGHRWINILQKERGSVPCVDVAYLPTMCNHCDDAPCIAEAKDDAITKRVDGIVIIDPLKAKGQRQLVNACPYGHIWWNEELDLPQAWNFDAHLIDDGWDKTRGAQACPTGAMKAIKVSDEAMTRLAQEENLDTLKPELNTRPRIYYKNLFRYAKCFVAGSLTAVSDGIVDCLEGAVVTLKRASDVIAETTSDNFGDFKIDHLEPESGEYQLEIRSERHDARVIHFSLGESTYLGEIRL